MLGPGEPSIANSGLGTAADHIAKYLGKHTNLTLVQPDQTGQIIPNGDLHTGAESRDFSDFAVISEMAHVNISGNISPYWYSSAQETSTKESDADIRKDLDSYAQKLIAEAEGINFDVIYAHDWITFGAAIELKDITKKPLILHVHSLDYDRNVMHTGSWVFELEKQALETADGIICVSNYSRKIVESVYGIKNKEIEVAYNGFQYATYPAFKSPYQEKIVLFVGRLTGQKGPTQFLEIAERVHEKDANTRFIMAGQGEMYEALIETGAHSSVAHKFHMTGYLEQEELLKLYAMSDVYCMPSVSEPFGLTAIEAAGAGLPQVISKNSGASEVLDGAVGVDFNDCEGFAKEIVRFLHNGSHTKNCVHLNQKSLQSLNWEKTGEQILAILSSV